jgi:hypothetical protein
LLRRLQKIHQTFGGDAAERKAALLKRLERRRLETSGQVLGLHEALCFLHAYPDDERVLETVRRMLAGFGRRSDVKRHAPELFNSGVAGTPTFFRFCWSTAQWLAREWPERLSIYWESFENQDRLDRLLALLVLPGESLALEEADLTTREWVDLLRGPDETDAVFLLRRMARMKGTDASRETAFDDLDVPFVLEAGPDAPSRTSSRYDPARVVFQTGPLDRKRPSLPEALANPPRSVRPVSRRAGRRLIDMTREAMVTRERDLYAFRNADPGDVRLVDCGGGLQFAAFGLRPERRLMLDSVYGYLTLKNGVPIGYVLSSTYFNSAEVAYNVFDTYRGAEAGHVFGRVIAMLHHLFHADAFTIDPYQLGHDNQEGLESGAWWFYYKLGFRPEDRDVQRLVRRELGRMRANPGYRSSVDTLQELSSVNMFWFSGRRRTDVRGMIPIENIGLHVSRYLARRFGSDRESAARTCASEAARLLGVRSFAGWTPGEREAWKRWSPLMLSLPGVRRWPAADRRSLVRVARAKGGHRESDYVLRLDRHGRLRRALLRMAE